MVKALFDFPIDRDCHFAMNRSSYYMSEIPFMMGPYPVHPM